VPAAVRGLAERLLWDLPRQGGFDVKRQTVSESRFAMPILALVLAEGQTIHAHGVVKAAKERGGVLGCSVSEIHRTLEDLANEGYLRETQGEIVKSKRFVRVYQCTEDGRKALAAWVTTRAPMPLIDVGELLARARIAPEVGARPVLQGLRELPDDIKDAKIRVRNRARDLRRVGTDDFTVQLETEWATALLDAFEGWLERCMHSLHEQKGIQERYRGWPAEGEAEAFHQRMRG